MDEEEDGLPILSKKPQATTEDPGDGLPILKKKPTNYVEKPTDEEDQQQQDFSTQQKRQLEQPFNNTSKPSEKSTPKKDESFSFLGSLKGAFDELKTAYSTPRDPNEDRPADPVVAAFKRGIASGEQADLLNPFRDIQEGDNEKIAETQKTIAKNKASAAYDKFSQSVEFGDALNAFIEDPLSITVELTAESLAGMASHGAPIMAQKISEGGVLGAVAGSIIPGMGTTAGAIGGASSGLNVGMAQTSLDLEYAGKFLEVLQESGVDTSDKDALKKAFEDDELIDEARAQGLKKGIPVALFDLISGGMAGKFTSKPAKGIVKRVASNLAEMGVQGSLGMAGEASGQLAAGEKLSAGAILGEGFGELATAPVQAAVGAKTLYNQNLSEVNEINKAAKAVDDAIAPPTETQDIPAVTQDVTVQPVSEDVTNTTQDTTQPATNEASQTAEPSTESIEPGGSESQDNTNSDGGSQESQEPTPGTGLPPAPDPQQSQEGQESPTVRAKSLLNRAFKGSDDPEVQAAIEKHGLTYEVESHEVAKENARAFIDEVGMEAALDSVRKSQVEDGAGAFIWANVIDDMGAQMAATEDPFEKKQLAQVQADLIAEFDRKARSGGRFSSALQEVYATSDFGYSADRQIEQYKAINNGTISPEVEGKFRELETQLNDANAKIKELESQRTQREEQDAVAAAKKDAGKTKTTRAKLISSEKKKEITSFFDSLKVDVSGTANDITRVVGSAVWNGSLDAVKAAVLAGADVANAVQAGVKYIQENFKGEGFVPDEYAQAIQPGVEKYVPKSKEKKAPKPQVPSVNKKGNVTIPNSIIVDLVEAGVDTIEELTSSIHTLMKNDFPDVTERQVRDAITQYGKTRNMSQDEVNKKIREMKRVGKLISGLEDVQRQMKPLRSGLQRDKLTDKERRMQKELKEAMKDLPVDEDEADNAWRTALDTVKARLKNQISDLEDQIATGKKTPKKKGVEYDDEAKALQEERDRLKEIIQAAEGKPQMSDEQKTRNAISAVERRIKEVEQKIKSGDLAYKAKPTKQATYELQAKRSELKGLNDTLNKMREESGMAERKRLDTYKTNIKNRIQDYQNRINNKDFVTPEKKVLDVDDEAKKLIAQKTKIKEEFEVLQEKNRLKNRPMGEKVWDTFVDAINLPKSLLASIDMSAPFRQGAILSTSNPVSAGKSFVEMFRQAFSQQRTDKWMDALKDTPEYSVMKDAKLFLAEPSAKLTAREDQFLSNLAERIPVIGKLVKGSSRAYNGYLNKLRVDVFNNGADLLAESGMTPKNSPDAYKSLAEFVNNATGRGNLGALETSAGLLNSLFFSPRFVASRVNLLNPATYMKMPAPVRKLALKSMISYIGFGTMVLAMAAAAGADVEEDPRSSDFGKIKVGNTRYDIWAGFQQLVRLIAQVSTGQKKSTTTGEIQTLGEGYKTDTRGDVALRFARTKLSPAASTAVNALQGKTIMGEEVTIQGETVKNALPLYIQDAYSIYKEEGPTGLATSAIPAFFGIGVQSYKPKAKKKEETKIGF